MDAYYVCPRCAHTFAAPERPDRCERCRQHGSWLISAGRDLDRAERLSEPARTSAPAWPGASAMNPSGDPRVHALAPEGRGLSCPACGWRVRAVAPEIESEGLICPGCGELIYGGRELDEWPAGTDEPPLAR